MKVKEQTFEEHLFYHFNYFVSQVPGGGYAAVRGVHRPDPAAGQVAAHRGQGAGWPDPRVRAGQLHRHILLAAQAYGAAYDS